METEKYPRTPYCPWSPSINEDALTADPRTLLGRPMVITEKIDGTNVLILNGVAYPRSAVGQGRTAWLGMTRKHHTWKTTGDKVNRYYGEDIYGVHSISYDPIPENETFMLFAIRTGDAWKSWDEVVQEAQRLNIKTVPELWKGTVRSVKALREMTEQMLDQPSALGGVREGVVIKTSGTIAERHFADNVCKVVRANHVQDDEAHWSHRWTPCQLLPFNEHPTS